MRELQEKGEKEKKAKDYRHKFPTMYHHRVATNNSIDIQFLTSCVYYTHSHPSVFFFSLFPFSHA